MTLREAGLRSRLSCAFEVRSKQQWSQECATCQQGFNLNKNIISMVGESEGKENVSDDVLSVLVLYP